MEILPSIPMWVFKICWWTSMFFFRFFFQTNLNFTCTEFEELCMLVVPIILGNARSMGESCVVSGRPAKLTPMQWFLNFILYLKHNNVISYHSLHWNWSRSSLCNDTLLIASCINYGLESKMHWPNANERLYLGMMNPHFPGCKGFIDGTLVGI